MICVEFELMTQQIVVKLFQRIHHSKTFSLYNAVLAFWRPTGIGNHTAILFEYCTYANSAGICLQ